MAAKINTQLFEAFDAGDVATIKRLLQSHPELLKIDTEDGRNLLHTAALNDNAAVVEALIEAGCDVNAASPENPETPLHVAASLGHAGVAAVLIRHGAEVNAGGGSYPTPLSYASYGDPKTVKVLVEAGADLNRSHGYPPTNPLALAIEHEAKENEALLRKRGARLPWEMPDWKAGEKRRALVKGHLEKALGPLKQLPGEAEHDPVDLWLARPTRERNSVVLVTSGLSAVAMDEEETGTPHSELVFELPGDWPVTAKELAAEKYGWPVQWMRLLIDGIWSGSTSVGDGQTVGGEDPDEPLGPGTKMSTLLFLHDLLEIGEVECDGETIYFLSIFPIHPQELEFKEKNGFEALFKLFEKKGMAAEFTPKRKSAV